MGLTSLRRHFTLTAIPLVALSYLLVLRPWQLTWGASPDEVARALPGDDLVERPTLCATRAVTIAAAWQLETGVDGTTRVITRVRSRYRWMSPTILFSALLEFADIWMMRKMLLNLRDRIEAMEPSTTAQ